MAKFSLQLYISLSKFRKKKKSDNFCVVFTSFVKRASEIRKFHLAVVQRWHRNVQNSVFTCKVVVCYCLFHKHENSKVEKPPSQLCFSLPSILVTNKQRTLKHRNTQNGSKSTNHKSETIAF